ncbi:MAG TPA: hypothetical protein ENJ53_00060 [Phaeodactylibacter sp.]|nr:hypothetical protein [Phaeodactylibacter sp.]
MGVSAIKKGNNGLAASVIRGQTKKKDPKKDQKIAYANDIGLQPTFYKIEKIIKIILPLRLENNNFFLEKPTVSCHTI